MEEQHPQPLSARPQIRAAQHHGGPAHHPIGIQQELYMIKQEAQQVRGAVLLLEQEKDSLRKAIRKLKLENTRMKTKVKTLQETVNKITGQSNDENGVENGAPEADKDYDELDRDFYLVGGIHDPLSLRYEVVIRDTNNVEHKSAERYYWYKMAETFNDQEAMAKILKAPNVPAAEEAVKTIRNFDEAAWDKVKLKFWEEGQRLKIAQVRWIANLLHLTGTTYLAVASQDKFFGTGWRKNREESNKTIFWDGLNEGGKVLMKIRFELKGTHKWNGPQEEEDTRKKLVEMKRYVWRRLDPQKRMMAPVSVGGRGGVGGVYGSRGGVRGGQQGMGGGGGHYRRGPYRGGGGGGPQGGGGGSTVQRRTHFGENKNLTVVFQKIDIPEKFIRKWAKVLHHGDYPDIK